MKDWRAAWTFRAARPLESPFNAIRNRPRLPGRVVTVNPEAMMVAPTPVAGDPIPAHAVIIIPRPMMVIRPIADRDRDTGSIRSHRCHGARAKQRGQ